MTEEPGRTCFGSSVGVCARAIQNSCPRSRRPFLPFISDDGRQRRLRRLVGEPRRFYWSVAELSATERRMTPEKTAFYASALWASGACLD